MASFCVYGLGVTGRSVIEYFIREKNFTDYCAWDDDAAMRNFFGVHIDEQKGKKIFSKNIDLVDFIISPIHLVNRCINHIISRIFQSTII